MWPPSLWLHQLPREPGHFWWFDPAGSGLGACYSLPGGQTSLEVLEHENGDGTRPSLACLIVSYWYSVRSTPYYNGLQADTTAGLWTSTYEVGWLVSSRSPSVLLVRRDMISKRGSVLDPMYCNSKCVHLFFRLFL